MFIVSADGLITATGAGIATLIARNGLFQASVSVTIIGNHRPFADAGIDQSVACTQAGSAGVAVTLNGELSSDLDGDGLSYAW